MNSIKYYRILNARYARRWLYPMRAIAVKLALYILTNNIFDNALKLALNL